MEDQVAHGRRMTPVRADDGAHPADRGPQRPPPDRAPDRARSFAEPVLVVAAAVAILEGYLWLDVIHADGWRPWALVFALATAGAGVALTRTRGHPGRVVGTAQVAAASFAVLAVTALALTVHGPAVASLAGAVDLVFALVALGAVVATGRTARRTPAVTPGEPGVASAPARVHPPVTAPASVVTAPASVMVESGGEPP